MTDSLSTVARILLGLIFVSMSINDVLQILPARPVNENMRLFVSALKQAGYFWPMLKGMELIAGLMLLANFRTLLALLILSPIVINITMAHLFLDRSGLAMAILLAALLCFQLVMRRAELSFLLVKKAKPS